MERRSSSGHRLYWVDDLKYNDKRLTSIQKEENKMMSEAMNTYDNMINQSDEFYKQQIDAAERTG